MPTKIDLTTRQNVEVCQDCKALCFLHTVTLIYHNLCNMYVFQDKCCVNTTIIVDNMTVRPHMKHWHVKRRVIVKNDRGQESYNACLYLQSLNP